MKAAVKEEKLKTETADSEMYCFVCTGNTCRSPMAEAVFNDKFKTESRYAVSAGLTGVGEPIAKNAVLALRDRGIKSTPDNDYENHVSRRLNNGIMDSAKAIIAMTSSHAMTIICAFPEYASKVYTLPKDIGDPYGGDLTRYKNCLAEINSALDEVFGENSKL